MTARLSGEVLYIFYKISFIKIKFFSARRTSFTSLLQPQVRILKTVRTLLRREQFSNRQLNRLGNMRNSYEFITRIFHCFYNVMQLHHRCYKTELYFYKLTFLKNRLAISNHCLTSSYKRIKQFKQNGHSCKNIYT